MKRRIKVSQKHIDNGIKQNPSSCPIACALQEIFKGREIKVHPGADDSKVGSPYMPCVAVWNDNILDWERFYLPVEANRFAKWFDRDRPVQPFEFEMELPV